MDELVDILDEEGNYTGETGLKSSVHLKGLYHPTIHVWFYTTDGRVLIQQRAKIKDTHPLLWDVSVAGHVGAGEGVGQSAVREVAEEIGLEIVEGDLEKIGVFKAEHRHSDILIDREFHHTFLCVLKVPLDSLTKQASEVDQLALIPLIQMAEETWGMANLKKYVPHGTAYYQAIIKAIKARL
tara:strand:+ start:309 stop:857 length:549 start_codon:yes stop_codon:yes gene_type:complete